LKIIRAARSLDLPLVVAGTPKLTSYVAKKYYRRCIREAGRNVIFVGHIPYPTIPALYRGARVHVVASWFEVVEKVSLEAGAAGCAVVTTTESYIREYLGEDAEYCDPADQKSIEQAIARAWEKGPSERLRERILTHYTWDRVTELTLQAYLQVLEGKG